MFKGCQRKFLFINNTTGYKCFVKEKAQKDINFVL